MRARVQVTNDQLSRVLFHGDAVIVEVVAMSPNLIEFIIETHLVAGHIDDEGACPLVQFKVKREETYEFTRVIKPEPQTEEDEPPSTPSP